MIKYRFRVSSAVIFTLYSYSKFLEYPFKVPTADSLNQVKRDLATVYMSRFFTGLIRTRAVNKARLNESVKQSPSIHGFVELQVV
jgi:hypothetical protein